MFAKLEKEEPQKTSEGIVRTKKQDKIEKKQNLTGYDSYQKEKDRTKESIRLENSYGSIAFGSNKNKEMTVVISEKRRHNRPGITNREKKIKESRQVGRFEGNQQIIMNNGDEGSGAIAFQYQSGVSRQGMVRFMTDYMRDHEQSTINHIMPFMAEKLNLSLIAAMKDLEKDKNRGFDRALPSLSITKEILQEDTNIDLNPSEEEIAESEK